MLWTLSTPGCDAAFVAQGVFVRRTRSRHARCLHLRGPGLQSCRRRARATTAFCRASSGSDASSAEDLLEGAPGRSVPSEDDDLVLHDDLKSDNEYVVIDGKDVDLLIRELQEKGLDDFGSPSDDVCDSLLRAVENVDGAKNDHGDGLRDSSTKSETGFSSGGNASVKSPTADSAPRREAYTKPLGGNGDEPAMEYFTEENVSFMPSWARTAFLNGTHHAIEEGSRRMGRDLNARRLEAMVKADRAKSHEAAGESHSRPQTSSGAARDRSEAHDAPGQVSTSPSQGSRDAESRENVAPDGMMDDEWRGSGIFDCCVSDVADDYAVPVELVIDIMATFGVSTPISPADGIRDRLTTEEIRCMLELITSFDSMDLAERYSDHTIAELADHYDLALSELLSICDAEGIYVPLGSDTRLQLTREDRVLDIARGKATLGEFEYPSLLHGLVPEEDA